MHQVLGEMLRAQIARAAAHVVAVLGKHRVAVIAASVEERKEPATLRLRRAPRAQVLEQRLAMHERDGGGAQRNDLLREPAGGGHRPHQLVVVRLPAIELHRTLEESHGHEAVRRRGRTRSHLEARPEQSMRQGFGCRNPCDWPRSIGKLAAGAASGLLTDPRVILERSQRSGWYPGIELK